MLSCLKMNSTMNWYLMGRMYQNAVLLKCRNASFQRKKKKREEEGWIRKFWHTHRFRVTSFPKTSWRSSEILSLSVFFAFSLTCIQQSQISTCRIFKLIALRMNTFHALIAARHFATYHDKLMVWAISWIKSGTAKLGEQTRTSIPRD